MADNSKIALGYATRSANRLGISLSVFLRRVSDGEKWCSSCLAWHGRGEFGSDRTAADGLANACKASRHRKERKPWAGGMPLGSKHSETTKARMRIAKLGAANNNWKGGITPAVRRARQHALYQQWRRAVLTRDAGRCQRCGCTPKAPHAHHVKPFKTHPQLALEVSNGLTVCPPCHRAIHTEERTNGGE